MFRYGSKLCALRNTYQNAEAGIAEHILALENRWLKLEIHVKFLHDVGPNLPERFQIHFNSLLAVVNAELIKATDTRDGTIGQRLTRSSIADIKGKEGRLHRGAFALRLKDSLDDTIRELETWQKNMWEPSRYQLVLIPGKASASLPANVSMRFRIY